MGEEKSWNLKRPFLGDWVRLKFHSSTCRLWGSSSFFATHHHDHDPHHSPPHDHQAANSSKMLIWYQWNRKERKSTRTRSPDRWRWWGWWSNADSSAHDNENQAPERTRNQPHKATKIEQTNNPRPSNRGWRGQERERKRDVREERNRREGALMNEREIGQYYRQSQSWMTDRQEAASPPTKTLTSTRTVICIRHTLLEVMKSDWKILPSSSSPLWSLLAAKMTQPTGLPGKPRTKLD